MFKKITSALELMKAGKRLANPAPWKNIQALTGILVTILGSGIVALGAFTGVEVDVSQTEIAEISATLAGVLIGVYGMYNAVTTVITTNKIGLKGNPE